MSVGLGYVAGLVATWFAAKWIVAAVIVHGGKLEAAQRRTVLRMAAAGGFVGLLPALLLGTVVGATFGSAYGEAALRPLGAGASGIVLGIALGMAIVVLLVMALAIALGALIGRCFARDDETPEPLP